MEWLSLLLLVPAILIPIVILFGFSGCGFSAGGSPGLGAPVFTSLLPVNEHEIRLEWTNPNSASVRFELLRTPEGPVQPPSPLHQTHYYDTQLTPGETYSYRVRAISTFVGESSEYSPAVTAVTWANAFTANLAANGQDADISHGCVVQRFDPPSLSRGGNLVRIVAQAAGNADLHIQTISLSGLSGGGGVNAQTPIDVFPGPYTSASNVVTIKARYRLEPHKPLLVAFDLDSPGHTRFGPATDVTAYTKDGTPQQPVREAGVANRSGFTEHPKQVWIVTSIDVATQWP